jgi:SNF2 family DNA or RNA helicase
MGWAEATLGHDGRIVLYTHEARNDFDFMLAASKRVHGGRFYKQGVEKYWHYPLSVDTCTALRREFGERLRVREDLAAWYRVAAKHAAAQTELASVYDANLTRVPRRFVDWLRGYQRSGASWIARGYRGAGLVADKPGVGKTPETLAAMLEADVRGPVLVVCPKSSVRSVWGMEAKRHLRGVPVYLCRGTRERRERMLALFTKHVQKDPNRLRIVVVVAEMLRVELGDPCYTMKSGNKISGMCPQRHRSPTFACNIHHNTPEEMKYFWGVEQDAKHRKKNAVPVGFVFPELFYVPGGWAWTVLDESHKLLGSLTISKGNLMGKGLRLLPERPDRRRYALSGTPFGKGGRVQGLFGTLHWLWPDEHTSFWKWAGDFLEIEEKQINRYGKTAKSIGGPKGLRADATPEEEAEAWERLLTSLGPRVLRRTKEEVMKELPPKTYSEVVCELTPTQRKQYEELATYAEVTTPGGIITVNGHLALALRSQQISLGSITKGNAGKVQFTQDSGKLDRLWENLDARGIIDGMPGEKLVIASRFNEFLDSVQAMLCRDKVGLLRIDGTVSEDRRAVIMNRWQEGLGPERVLLVNTKAGGVSINLDAADEMHIMDEDPDPGVNEQLEDRIHRASRVHKVIIFYYRTEGTLDYVAAHNVEFRRRLQHAILDGRRGVVDLKALMNESLEEVA